MEISEFLKNEEAFPDPIYGNGYRCSVYLKDGLFLPCVIIRRNEKYIELACQRLEEVKKRKGIFHRNTDKYREIVKNFVTSGNRINDYDIKSVEKSQFAIPISLLDKIEGETVMSWTGFVLEMKDGKLFSFGTSYQVEFFNLPKGYSFEDVSTVHNHSYVNSSGKIISIERGIHDFNEDYDHSSVYRERPYFTCFID